MLKLVAFSWLLLPMAVLVWLQGSGERHLERDAARALIRDGQRAEANEDWEQATVAYTQALASLGDAPELQRQQLRLARARTRVMSGELVEGQEELEDLVAELEGAGNAHSPLAANARHELATSSYYAGWLMRLEGALAEEWKPEVERARQQFRLLAENTEAVERAEVYKRNLEAAIKLEQMDLSELLAKPLPKNCPKNCRSLCQRKRKQCQSRCNQSSDNQQAGKKKQQQRQDARQSIKQQQRGAGLNQRIGSGS